jgi:hypothetical protein
MYTIFVDDFVYFTTVAENVCHETRICYRAKAILGMSAVRNVPDRRSTIANLCIQFMYAH